MYNPLNADLMIQDVHDRAARATAGVGKDRASWPNRRWWHKGARAAR